MLIKEEKDLKKFLDLEWCIFFGGHSFAEKQFKDEFPFVRAPVYRQWFGKRQQEQAMDPGLEIEDQSADGPEQPIASEDERGTDQEAAKSDAPNTPNQIGKQSKRWALSLQEYSMPMPMAAGKFCAIIFVVCELRVQE